MSSGQWEVVGKSKKSQNGKIKNLKDDEKKPTKNVPKLEDVVPHSQIKTFYAGMEIDDDRKPSKEKKNGDKKKKQSKNAEPSKPKPPKTLEGALQAIDPAELNNIITTNKIRFSNAPLVWLKEVANYLNSKTQIDIDDPIFFNYSDNYPLSEVPKEVKTSLASLLQDAGKANLQLFFDVTLTALANDMSRGLHVNGHRILLQMLAKEYPEFCISSLPKSISLRNSYQNRPPIGLSLLWSLGQGGLTDFSIGIKAWQELFLPIIDLKNYSKYVISYISKLVDRYSSLENVKISQEQLLSMFDLVNSKKNGLSKDLSSDLIKQLSKYKDIYLIKSGNKLQVTFNQLMKKLPNQYLSGSSLDSYNQVIVEALIDCLERDDSCNATWMQLFQKCSKQTATVLEYLDTHWTEINTKLKMKPLKVSVKKYQEVCGDTLRGKKKDETVVKANKICQDILDRMTSARRFPWFWASFFLLLSIAGLVTYDVSRVGGNFPKSATGRLMNDLGILEHSQVAWQKTLSYSARGYVWLETNTPVYYEKTVEVLGPYAQVTKDLFIIGAQKAGIAYGNIRTYIVEKAPLVAATVDGYAPGLIDKVQEFAINSYDTVKKYSINYYNVSADYLTTKVFIGEWAPEILQNKTQTALNATRTQVTMYFHWFREQVNVYSKIP